MSGHVFHPGHAELHGITVVLETTTGELLVGRFDEETSAGVRLNDVAEYRAASGGPTREEFVQRTLKFGVRAEHRQKIVPTGEVQRVSRLTEWG